jgi:hypothetical protein
MTLKKDKEKLLKELKRKPKRTKMSQMMIKIQKINHTKVMTRISQKRRKRKNHKLLFQKVLLKFHRKW